MNTFFSGLIMIGISLILISIIVVMFDRKKDSEEKSEYISIRNDLRELLEDSSEMVDELNRFSDYIVTKVDNKCTEYKELLKPAHENKENVAKEEAVKVQETYFVPEVEIATIEEPLSNIQEINTVNEAILFTEELESDSPSKEGNKSINPKHSEVLKLFEAGMSDIEIAKALNIGKGEVQLIIGLNLHKIKV